jgi:L-amino acid N-acyltransferase YncA
VLRTLTVGSRTIELRYMDPDDASRMLTFARSLKAHDLLFLPTDITQADGINAWVEDVLRGQVAVIVALAGDEILGFSSVSRSATRWMRHVATLRVVVGDSARGQGLGGHLTAEAFRVAVDMGVTRMLAQMTLDQVAAIETFRNMGFTPLAVLEGHVLDDDGKSSDLLLMHQEVASFDETLEHLD